MVTGGRGTRGLKLRSTRRVEGVVEVGCAWMVEGGVGKIAAKPGMN